MREHINAAVRLVNEGAAVVDSGAGVEVNYANAINARLNQMGYNNPDELMNIRAAIQAVLTNRILGSDNLQKLGNAQNFMEACRDEISRRRSPRQAEVDGQQGTFTPERGPDCGYRRVSDLSGYFETSESERPYVIFNEDDGICYQQDGDIMTETRQVNNNRTEVRTMHVRNPVPPNNGFRNVALNNTTFDIGNEATSRNDFVLFEFVCDGDDDPYDFGTEREGRSAY